MHKDKRKYGYIILLIIVIIVIIDYIYYKNIPNILFMNDFRKENVASYWTGVISMFVAGLSLMTFHQTADKYFFDKKAYIEMQKKDAIRRYQDLLKNAIDIFHNKSDNEYESLFAVQIVKNIIDLSCNIENEKNNKNDIEPFQIISLEGALGILKSHLDKVLASDRCLNGKQQDVTAIMQIIYHCNQYKWNKSLLYRLGIYDFKNVSLDIAYFDYIKLYDCNFKDVKFYGDIASQLILENNCKFVDCKFECNLNIDLGEFATLTFEHCTLQEISFYPDRRNNRNKLKQNATKSLIFEKCTVEGFVNLDYCNFFSLSISNCKFNTALNMHEIFVESEFVVDHTEFEDSVDFQGSVIRWKLAFTNTECKGMFYFWNSKLLKRTKLYFDNFYVRNFESPNLSVTVYDDPNDPLAKRYTFGDIYKVVWSEGKKMNYLELK